MFPFEQIAYAMAPASGESGPMGAFIQFLPLVLIFVIFWFLVIRPQQRKQKLHREMLGNLKKGDEVYTDSGIRGTILRMGEENITLEIAPKVAIRLQRGRVADVIKGGKPAEPEAQEPEA
ncbi:MAG TPA: preprotein translocase subunit YajC [bacterium]|nr:preprotein translocase subunit YajC [bacterium]